MVKPQLSKWWAKIKSLPKEYTIIPAVIAVFVIVYGIVFSLDKQVAFSYAHPSCANYFTLLPALHKKSGDAPYRVFPADVIRFGDVVVAAKQICFIPTEAPKPGVTKVSVAPFGGWVMQKTFAIAVDAPPVANVKRLDQPIPATLPLNIPLSTTDKLFEYSIKANGNKVMCVPKEKVASCNLEELKLDQGTHYTLQLTRQFNGETIATLAKEKTKTLPAARVTRASVKPNETVYAKPKIFTLQFDKQIKNANVALYRIKDEKRTPVEASIKLKGKYLHLATRDHLTRQTPYKLVVESVMAVDGSGLEKPYVLPFKMSGGPRVRHISIGTVGVSAVTAVITFDQALSEGQDINRAVGVSGGAKVAKVNGRKIFISLAGVPRCGDFSIKINDKLESRYGITGGSEWQYEARKICHVIKTIGYSTQGRPINAYFFGDGPVTIMYTGAIHGSEASTHNLMMRWIGYLEVNARRIPSEKQIVVVPTINPDGVAVGSRTNANNVDLNRNFATSDWQEDITTVNNQPFEGGGGDKPMSEPETRAIAGLASRLRPSLILSYHSVGGMVAANQAGNSAVLANLYAQMTGYRNITGQSDATFEYSISGTADDWYAQELGAPSILVELGTTYYHEFERNRDAMWAMLE